MKTLASSLAVAAVIAGLALPALAGYQPTCDQVLAAMEKAGGSQSTDEVAKSLNTTPEHVRECMARTGGGKPSMIQPDPATSPGAAPHAHE